MSVFAVQYHYDPAQHDRRLEHRADHRAFLTGLFETGILLAAGAWADEGAPGGLLITRADSAAEIERALDGDPYHRTGVLARREVREWAQLFGPWA